MSDAGKADTSVETEVGDLEARYEKKDKVVVMPSDDMEAFLAFVEKIGKDNYKDWTEGAPDTFNALAMVRSENQGNRLIAIPSEEDAFNDPTVRKALYRMFVNRVVNSAGVDDATQAQFLTVGGCFKQKFDVEAFKFQAKALAKFLRSQGLSGVTNNSLRMSFASSAFAKTQFPRISDDAWTKIIAIAKQTAEKNGHDISIFEHWEATRAVQTADTSILDLDFGELEKVEEAVTEGEANAS